MAGNKALNNDDSMDINELAALNGDISPELIEQLQQKLSQDAQTLAQPAFDETDDTTLFEEPIPVVETTPGPNETAPETKAEKIEQVEETPAAEPEKTEIPKLDKSIDDNFIKKYKAKLEKQRHPFGMETESTDESTQTEKNENTEEISKISNGTITEKEMTLAQQQYNDSLDLLDGNVKYSKYVIYVDPQNVDFIESLTVKERKNLINRILREQDDISITRKKFQTVQTIIKHTIVAILTIAISIPVIYWAINASLEASINNHRRAETNWGTLYRDNGKINVKQP